VSGGEAGREARLRSVEEILPVAGDFSLRGSCFNEEVRARSAVEMSSVVQILLFLDQKTGSSCKAFVVSGS
jgi:hypothetical protein